MRKRGQVTVFIVIGLIALIGAVFIFNFVEKGISKKVSQESIEAVPESVEPIKKFVESCLQSTAHEAIYFVSTQGGYYYTPAPYFNYSWFSIPYYMDAEIFNYPSLEITEKELSKYIEENLDFCLNSFITFSNFNVTSRIKTTTVKINTEDIIFSLNLPLSIFIGDKVINLEKFEVREKAELGLALNLIPQIIESQKEFPNRVRLSDLTSLSEANGIEIALSHYNNTVFYKLKYPLSSFNNEDYIFMFAMKYDWI